MRPTKMKVLTTKEIRELTEGSIVREHSLDKYGYPQYLDITVEHRDGKVKFYYYNGDGRRVETKLRSFKPDDPYRYYELIKKGETV